MPAINWAGDPGSSPGTPGSPRVMGSPEPDTTGEWSMESANAGSSVFSTVVTPVASAPSGLAVKLV